MVFSVEMCKWHQDEDQRLHFKETFESSRHVFYGMDGDSMMFCKDDIPRLDIYCKFIVNITDQDRQNDVLKQEHIQCVKELCKMLGNHVHTIHNWAEEGDWYNDTFIFFSKGTIHGFDLYCRCTLQKPSSMLDAQRHEEWIETLTQMLPSHLARVHESQKERHQRNGFIKRWFTNVNFNELPGAEREKLLERHREHCMRECGRLVQLEYVAQRN